MQHILAAITSLIIISTAQARPAEAFNLQAPDEKLTPGALCSEPDSYRYVEQIPYCERKVSSGLKLKVLEKYMQLFPDLKINVQNRLQYKVDHYIPLCMGGSNEITNLWPQHESVYLYTDEIEFNLCSDLADGIITQKDAILKMKFAKNHLDQLRAASDPMDFLERNYSRP